LDNLFETGRISQATRDSFDNDISAVITEIEKQQKDLVTKMQGKTQELEGQIKTLETLLANYEIQHVVGEIEEEVYQREINLLSTGLESAKRELEIIKEAANHLCPPPVEAATTEPVLPAEETVAEVVQTETVENVPTVPEEVTVVTEPCPQEPAIAMEQAVPEQPAIESADTSHEEAPQVVEEITVAPENAPETTADIPEVVQEIPAEIENTPPTIEETPATIEDIPQVLEEMPQIVEEIPHEAHPQKAPEEAPQEITVEAASEQEQSVAEESAAVETDEDTEKQDEVKE
jgi:hypothetical protein